jgi:hypothetical protein
MTYPSFSSHLAFGQDQQVSWSKVKEVDIVISMHLQEGEDNKMKDLQRIVSNY